MLKDPVKTKNEIVQWIRDYFEENGKGCKAVIGISGGKDSSIAAALCAEALGKERVVGVLMPNGVQSDISDSRKLVEFLGIPYVELNIGNAFQAMKAMLTDSKELLALSGTDGITRDTEINLPPRLRMSTLYAVGQMKGGICAACLPLVRGGAREERPHTAHGCDRLRAAGPGIDRRRLHPAVGHHGFLL